MTDTSSKTEACRVMRVLVAISRCADLAWREGREEDARKMWWIVGSIEYLTFGFQKSN